MRPSRMMGRVPILLFHAIYLTSMKICAERRSMAKTRAVPWNQRSSAGSRATKLSAYFTRSP